MRAVTLFAAAALSLSACATVPTGAPPPEGPAAITGELELGDWRNGTQAATLASFEQSVAGRYGAGVQTSAASADLRRQEFSCGDAPAVDEQGRGDPPAQVCRRTITASGCTHTWQAHLFEQSEGRLERTRGLYDRRCGNEGLLGGPG
jgi:hypothetical protein